MMTRWSLAGVALLVRRIRVAIGPAGMQTLAPLHGRFSQRVTAVFDWTPRR
jgi:hypothetical protein